AVDPIQKIQLVLLSNCRDATSTRFAVQRLFDWLDRSGEGDLLVNRLDRARKSRGRFVESCRPLAIGRSMQMTRYRRQSSHSASRSSAPGPHAPSASTDKWAR